MAIITLSGIEKVYRTKEIETTALENVNLEVNQGEFVSIMGPSGCGKSTLLNIIGLLDKPTKGTVTLLDQNCSGLTDRQLSALPQRQPRLCVPEFPPHTIAGRGRQRRVAADLP